MPEQPEETRVVGKVNFATGDFDLTFEPLDLVTKLARLVDPRAGDEIDVTPPPVQPC